MNKASWSSALLSMSTKDDQAIEFAQARKPGAISDDSGG
jgi:hypothetical protein